MTMTEAYKKDLALGAKDIKKMLESKAPSDMKQETMDEIVVNAYFSSETFRSEHGRDPTEEEAEELLSIILTAISD